jgi:hypothetical protein
MHDTTYEKKPAFFRVVQFEAFFEADSADADMVMASLNGNTDLDAELDAILAS